MQNPTCSCIFYKTSKILVFLRRGANISKVLGASNIDLFDKKWTTILLNFAN